MKQWLLRCLAMLLAVSMTFGAAPAGATSDNESRPSRLADALGRIETQLIVRFEPDVSPMRARAEIKATRGTIQKSASRNTRLVAYSSASGAQAALKQLNGHAGIVYAFYNQRVNLPPKRMTFTPHDHHDTWHLEGEPDVHGATG